MNARRAGLVCAAPTARYPLLPTRFSPSRRARAIARKIGAATGVDLPVAVVDNVNTATPVLYYVHADHLGRPIALTNSAKAFVWQANPACAGPSMGATDAIVRALREGVNRIGKSGRAGVDHGNRSALVCLPASSGTPASPASGSSSRAPIA